MIGQTIEKLILKKGTENLVRNIKELKIDGINILKYFYSLDTEYRKEFLKELVEVVKNEDDRQRLIISFLNHIEISDNDEFMDYLSAIEDYSIEKVKKEVIVATKRERIISRIKALCLTTASTLLASSFFMYWGITTERFGLIMIAFLMLFNSILSTALFVSSCAELMNERDSVI